MPGFTRQSSRLAQGGVDVTYATLPLSRLKRFIRWCKKIVTHNRVYQHFCHHHFIVPENGSRIWDHRVCEHCGLKFYTWWLTYNNYLTHYEQYNNYLDGFESDDTRFRRSRISEPPPSNFKEENFMKRK